MLRRSFDVWRNNSLIFEAKWLQLQVFLQKTSTTDEIKFRCSPENFRVLNDDGGHDEDRDDDSNDDNIDDGVSGKDRTTLT